MPHPADMPIGWELAARYPHLYRDGPLALTPKPCPICGHPTGSCTQEDHAIMAGQRTQSEKAKDPVDTYSPEFVRTALQGGRPTAEEAIARTAEGQPATVVVKEDVYEEVHDPGAIQTRTRLRYHKGQVITAEEADRNKVKAVQQQNVRAVNTK